MDNLFVDELQLFRQSFTGGYKISEHVTILHPTLGQICDTSELMYYNMASMLTSNPDQLMVELADIGKDYTKVTDFELFIMVCAGLKPEMTALLFGDLDFSTLLPGKNEQNDSLVLVRQEEDGSLTTVFDELLHIQVVDYVRKMHGFEKVEKKPANEETKNYFIDRERKKRERRARQNEGKRPESMLAPLISAMVNQPGFKYNYDEVWSLPINIFNDAVARTQKFLHYSQLMTAGYSGSISLKEVNKDDLNWLGSLRKKDGG